MLLCKIYKSSYIFISFCINSIVKTVTNYLFHVATTQNIYFIILILAYVKNLLIFVTLVAYYQKNTFAIANKYHKYLIITEKSAKDSHFFVSIFDFIPVMTFVTNLSIFVVIGVNYCNVTYHC